MRGKARKVVKHSETPRSSDPTMRQPNAGREEKRVTGASGTMRKRTYQEQLDVHALVSEGPYLRFRHR